METLEQKTEKKLQQKEVLRPKFLYLCMFITSYTMLNVYYGEYFTGIFLKIYLIITIGYITTTCMYIYFSRKRYPDDFLFLLYIFVSAVNILINGLRMNMSLLYIVVIISIFSLFFMMLIIILLRKKFFLRNALVLLLIAIVLVLWVSNMGMPPLNNAYLIAMLLFLAQVAKHYFYLSDYNLENREIVIMKDDILNAIVLNIVAILALVIQIGGYTIFFLSVFF